MNSVVRRIFVEKKAGFDIEAKGLLQDLKVNLGIENLKGLRIINRYDIEGISDIDYEKSRNIVFSEPPVDIVYDEVISLPENSRCIAIEYLPGQYDQRADSASQCIQILVQGEKPKIKVAKLIILIGAITDEDYLKIKDYCINPVECQEASLDKPLTLEADVTKPYEVSDVKGFISFTDNELMEYMKNQGFAMSFEDLKFCKTYFNEIERRDPTITELKVIDTYWSDHCRHTTFLTNINNVEIKDGHYTKVIKSAFEAYLGSRAFVNAEKSKDISLMDIATVAAKELKKRNKVNDLDISDEINACSIVVDVDVDGKNEEWLVMFKNETHNHPTEIEPFGGAATCLGGAIRDPLSGRAYVYQAMRVTGSGDPRAKVKDTISGKLPQRKITTGAAAGYSSYGNQIGIATGQVTEIYDQGFVAKRMEIGAVIAAVPEKNVVREKPQPGDVIILLGGRTGRDGCGGATGSSKEHTEESLAACGAEVQKGNPPTERKIQRLFRNPEVSKLIKKCNDFGAGGVCVAVGELADSLEINLDSVPRKYEGLDGTELAISESQERMAVVVLATDAGTFIEAAAHENLEAVEVARVTSDNRLKMNWNGANIVNISRDFLNTNGVKQNADVVIEAPAEFYYNNSAPENSDISDISDKACFGNNVGLNNIEEKWLANLEKLNVCSQKGLVERFDSTIGAGTVIMPFGGKYQLSPSEGMVAKIPVLHGDTTTGTAMTFGYNPDLAKWSPFHGAMYSVIEATAKITALGGDFRKVRLTLQEYFEKLGKDPVKWGKPFSALLGAYRAQMELGLPAIGGKDSMSGTFKDMNVPPTLVTFAVGVIDTNIVISTEFKKTDSRVVLIPLIKDSCYMPDFKKLGTSYTRIYELCRAGKILSASTIKSGGIAEVISKMSFGNKIGFSFNSSWNSEELFKPDFGSIVVEIANDESIDILFKDIDYIEVGRTIKDTVIQINGCKIKIDKALEKWEKPLEAIFPSKTKALDITPKEFNFSVTQKKKSSSCFAKPRIFIPVFPGTNCEYDSARAFEKAGGIVDTLVIKNLTSKDIEASLELMTQKVNASQIVMLPGGFSGGDEPDGSGKFIAAAFRNPNLKEAVMKLLKQRDGLIIGICNGFQALIKLGLVPYGEIRDMKENDPTLTFNTIGRHVSCMVQTKITSNLSPWFNNVSVGDIHTIAVSHGEGRFVADEATLKLLEKNGQVATQYVDITGLPTYNSKFNPNGSVDAIEGITSPDGRVLGKMGHSERIGNNVIINVPGEKDQKLFQAGVSYFK